MLAGFPPRESVEQGEGVAGVVVGSSLGAPFLIAGALKSAYDLAFYALFRRTPVAEG